MNEKLLKEVIIRCSEYYLSKGIRIDEQNVKINFCLKFFLKSFDYLCYYFRNRSYKGIRDF
jgi:hypothetical protein